MSISWIAKNSNHVFSSKANHISMSDSDFSDLMRIIVHVMNALKIINK
jgi:hypothetical protein